MRHLRNKHSDLLLSDIVSPKQPNFDEYFVRGTSELPSLPALDRQAIAACASNHVIPFDLVEDPVFQWAYGAKCRDRKKVSDRVTELAKEWRQSLKENMSGSSVSILLDGWTNSIFNNRGYYC